MRVAHTPGNWTTTRTPYNSEPCGENFPFSGLDFINLDDLSGVIQCPTNQSFEVSGSRVSSTQRFIEIVVSKCNNSTYQGICKTPEEIDNLLLNTEFSMGIVNRFFDFDDYDDPVKTYATDQNVYKTIPGFHKIINLYLRRSEYSINDALIQCNDPSEGGYYSIENDKVDIQAASNDTIMTLNIVQDTHIDQYSRTVYTFLDMTGQLGGLYEVFSILTSFLIGGIVNKCFNISVIKDLYYFEPKNEDEKFTDKNPNLKDISKSTNRKIHVLDKSMSSSIFKNTYEDNMSQNKKAKWYQHKNESK